MDKKQPNPDEIDLNAIKISIPDLRQLAIDLMKAGINELGLKDLLYMIQTMYRNSKD